MIKFSIFFSNTKSDIKYYRPEEKLSLCEKPYRNMNERLLDSAYEPKLKHAHSYDINSLQQHQRHIEIKDRKCLLKNFNSLNKSVYKDHKNHVTHCKIYANSKDNFSETIVNIVILFRPQNSYYKHKQIVEDYLYIDVSLLRI